MCRECSSNEVPNFTDDSKVSSPFYLFFFWSLFFWGGLWLIYGVLQVLDLMVRMLGFSDEDKQRIGVAQQGGRGVVRGVLGLPGRLVGGILGGSSADVHANAASDNQVCSLYLMLLEIADLQTNNSVRLKGIYLLCSSLWYLVAHFAHLWSYLFCSS